MGKLAVRAVDLAPFLEYGQDRGHLIIKQTMRRVAARGQVIKAPGPGQPPVVPCRRQSQIAQGRGARPTSCYRCINQVEQRLFRGRIHTPRDRAT